MSSLIRHRVTIPASIRTSDPITAGWINQHGCGTARYALRPDPADVVTAGLKLLERLVRNRRFHVQAVETCIVGPERSKEVQRLDTRPLERFVQIGIPVVPKLDYV